jgi:hypothetical protein
MTSTTHGPSQASADSLGLPNTWSTAGVRYYSPAHVHNLIPIEHQVTKDLKILLVSEKLKKTSNFTKNWSVKNRNRFCFPSWQQLVPEDSKMTSTAHEPSEVAADGLGLPNTRSADGLPNKDL